MVGSGYFGMLQIGLLPLPQGRCELLVRAFDFQETDIPTVLELIARSPCGRGPARTDVRPDDLLNVLYAAGVPVVRIAPHSDAAPPSTSASTITKPPMI